MHENIDSLTTKVGQIPPCNEVYELSGAQLERIWVHTCPTPGCSCRTALVIATLEGHEHLLERGAAYSEAWSMGANHADVAERFDDLIFFNLDIDSAEITSALADEPLDLASHPYVEDIAKHIDGELLDAIGRLWYRGKGLPDPEQEALPPGEIRRTGWKRGEMLGWDDAFMGVRQDFYLLDGQLYEAAEMYCPVPGCKCGEVFIFFEIPEPQRVASPGYVIVKETGAIDMQPNGDASALLGQLWTAFRQRHPNYLARFARRYPIMKAVGARILPTTPAVSSKVGRNDPCPCGSGKKYKQCCGKN